MSLAVMIATDEDALVCDLAETYQIYNYRELPVQTLAVFAYGLSNDSRIKRKLIGCYNAPLDAVLLAELIDSVRALTWMLSNHKGQKPASLADSMIMKKEADHTNNKTDIMVFDSIEEFNNFYYTETR